MVGLELGRCIKWVTGNSHRIPTRTLGPVQFFLDGDLNYNIDNPLSTNERQPRRVYGWTSFIKVESMGTSF